MELLTIIAASAVRTVLYFCIAIMLGSFLPIMISVLFSSLVEPLTFAECVSSGVFVISTAGGIIVSLFWIADKSDKYNNNKRRKIERDKAREQMEGINKLNQE